MSTLSERYGRTAVVLHWLVALLIGAALVLAWVLPRRNAPGYDVLLELHKSVGMVVLAVVVPRLLWKLRNRVAPAASLTPIEARLSAITHWALYAIMLIIPLSGYLFSSAEGQHLDFFGLFTAASPMVTDRTISHAFEFVHKAGQNVVYVIVGLHVLAALYHYFVKRDGVLERMLPLGSAGDD